MLPPVVVDLGPIQSSPEAALVLEACNEAIASGVCITDDELAIEPPRARATARALDDAMRVVRIDVLLRGAPSRSHLSRELHFGARDPAAERWRSVGLAIATLVGEGERARQEEARQTAEAPRAETPAPTPRTAPTAPSGPEPASPPRPPITVRRAPSRAPEVRDSAPAEDAGPAPPPRRGWFIAAGGLAATALEQSGPRWGGLARGGASVWGPLEVRVSIAYSEPLAPPEGVGAYWLSGMVGAGYRVPLARSLDLALALELGVQRLGIDARRAGTTQTEHIHNALFGASAEAWWWITRGFGVWAGVSATSVGRRTRVYVAEPLVAVTQVVDGVASLGLGWCIE